MLKDWSDAYAIGVSEIDEQHKGFFAASRRLYTEILDQKAKEAVVEAIAFLREYAQGHFSTEEGFMARHRYPDLKDHQRLHGEFLSRLEDLEQELSVFGPSRDLADRALEVTQDWLIEHIADEDVLYALYIKSR